MAASGRLRFVLRELAADVGTLTPSKGWLRDASHCVIGEHPMLPWLALTFTAARLGFEAQNAKEAPPLAVAAPKKRSAAKVSKKPAPAKRQRKRSKGR